MEKKDSTPPYTPPAVNIDGDPDNANWLRIVAADRRRQKYPPRVNEELAAGAVPAATDLDRVTAFSLSMNGYGPIGRWRLQEEAHGAYLAWRDTGHLPHDLTRLRCYLYSEEQDRWVGDRRELADPTTDPRWPFTVALLEAIREELS